MSINTNNIDTKPLYQNYSAGKSPLNNLRGVKSAVPDSDVYQKEIKNDAAESSPTVKVTSGVTNPINTSSGALISYTGMLPGGISDTSSGYSSRMGVYYPKRNINKNNFEKIGTESETIEQKATDGPRRGKNKQKPEKITVEHDVYLVKDKLNGLEIKCWGNVDPETGDLQMTQLREVSLKNHDGTTFVSKFPTKLSDCKEFNQKTIDELLTNFAEATTGFCKSDEGYSGIKSLAEINSRGETVYPAISNGKKAKFELKIMGNGNMKYNFGDMRFFSYDAPQFNPKTNTWKIDWASFERHSSLH